MLTISRIPLGRAHMLASTITYDARRAGLRFDSLTPLGSLRRFAPEVGDVSLLGIAPQGEHAGLLEGFTRLRTFTRVISKSSSHVSAEGERGPITLYLARRDQPGAALAGRPGPASP